MRFCTCLVVSASLLLASCGDDPLVAKKSGAARAAEIGPSPYAAEPEQASLAVSDPEASNPEDAGGGAECITDDGAPYVAPSC